MSPPPAVGTGRRIGNGAFLTFACLLGILLVGWLVVGRIGAERDSLRFDLRLARDGAAATVEVDATQDLAWIDNGQNQITRLQSTANAIGVYAADFGLAGEYWIEVPLGRVDPAYRALRPNRLEASLRLSVRECKEISDDARVVAELFLEPSRSPSIAKLCDVGVGVAVDDGVDYLVRRTPVPSFEAASDVRRLGSLPPHTQGIVLRQLDEIAQDL